MFKDWLYSLDTIHVYFILMCSMIFTVIAIGNVFYYIIRFDDIYQIGFSFISFIVNYYVYIAARYEMQYREIMFGDE